ncbi:hypothetical protein F4679DRAFT_412595 [Xylaria curta]|nr:hypothetical protein F4679DRAFT_412595 [Xylaria curta]
MASESTAESIADCVARSLAAFEAIGRLNIQAEIDDSRSIWVETIRDQFSKFKLWAGNIGAHRSGRSSLDYRLRDSSHLHTQVMRLLDDITTSLNEVHSILSGETVPWDQNPGDTSELDEFKDLLMNEEFEFNSELDQLTEEITDAVGNLLRLSMSLRNPAPHDRFMSTEYAKVHYFEANDRAHVDAKFPNMSEVLITRLGQALSQRRQYFRYRESHHEKLAHGLFDPRRSEADAQSTVASSIPKAMKVYGVPVFGELDEDQRSDTGFSQTSFATTNPESNSLRIPPLPKKAYDGPFECPFCFMLISVRSTNQWKKHVLHDLRPYICLVEGCTAASKEYSRRHEWINHMLQNHWISWTCPYQCELDSTSETNLRQHITRTHGFKTEMELDAMIARRGRTRLISPSSPIECPFCQDTLVSVQQYQRHVGRHQVDLALFALPKIEDDEELDEANEDNETTSTRSGSYSEAMSDISPTALDEPIKAFDESELDWSNVTEDERPFKIIIGSNVVLHGNPQPMGELSSESDSNRELQKTGELYTEPIFDSTDIVHMQNLEFADRLEDVEQQLGDVQPPYSQEDEPGIIKRRTYSISDLYSLGDSDESRDQDRSVALPNSSRQDFEPEIDQERRTDYRRNLLKEIRLASRIEKDEKRRDRTTREEQELREAKEELDAIRKERERDELEHRIKQKIDLDRLQAEEAALAEKSRREKEAKEAVEKYKKEEASRNLSVVDAEQVRLVGSQPKPQCWEHGCNGREFSTFRDLSRHQREESGQAAKVSCPNCGAGFASIRVRDSHLRSGKCKKRRNVE